MIDDNYINADFVFDRLQREQRILLTARIAQDKELIVETRALIEKAETEIKRLEQKIADYELRLAGLGG